MREKRPRTSASAVMREIVLSGTAMSAISMVSQKACIAGGLWLIDCHPASGPCSNVR